MTWVVFDEEDHYHPAPVFCLPALDGEMVCRTDFLDKYTLALLFLPPVAGPNDYDWLENFAGRVDDYRAAESQVVAVLPSTPTAGQRERLNGLPFPVLVDDGDVRPAYAGLMAAHLSRDQDALLFVLDKVGAPYSAYIGTALDEPGLHADLLSWLDFVGLQCPT